ncbi:MAG: hypothetical protein JJLCMIEE_02209 [Acidimicrobiales bacterium]|nr:MAG: hypothetical protein EDR02_08260 [Actinomycetota bacterium]MBV6509141.1 hypothetical protein [Acidimicrobiales bacterium]RIK08510.1 MAG: hypothetical protein DCC48_00745 [Acidobacteriota bacterium]
MCDNADVVSEQGPRRLWYWIAGLIALAGIGSAIAWGLISWNGLVETVDDFERIAVPGQARLDFSEATGYTIYYEESDQGPEATYFGTPGVEITNVATAEVLPVSTYLTDLTYNLGGRRGVALYTFEVDEPGEYEVVVTGEAGPNSGVELAFGPGIGGTLVWTILGALALLFGGFVLAIVVAVVVAVRRASVRRKYRQQALPPPPYAPPSPTPGWPIPPPPGHT